MKHNPGPDPLQLVIGAVILWGGYELLKRDGIDLLSPLKSHGQATAGSGTAAPAPPVNSNGAGILRTYPQCGQPGNNDHKVYLVTAFTDGTFHLQDTGQTC